MAVTERLVLVKRIPPGVQSATLVEAIDWFSFIDFACVMGISIT